MKRVTKRELAVSLHAAGRTVEEIADTLNVPLETASAWLGLVPYAERFKNCMVAYDAMLNALQALQGPDGHIWHGDECTGECRDVQEAVKMGEAARL